MMSAPPYLLDQIESVPNGHCQITHQHVEAFCWMCQRPERVFGTAGGDHARADALKYPGQHPSCIGFVVNYQHPQSVETHGCTDRGSVPGGYVTGGSFGCRAGRGLQDVPGMKRYANGERGATILTIAMGFDRAAVHFDQMFGDG